jgi:hypothetical protein
MSYRNRIKFVFCLLCLSLKLSAQQEPDVTGLWRGFMYNDTTQLNYRYEIAISENGKGKLIAYSHTYFIVNDKEYHGVKKLKIKRDGDEIITEDDDLIANNYPEPPNKNVHQKNTLVLKIKDTVMTLSGGYQTNRTRFFHPVTGYIHVERKKDYSQSALIPHLQELGLAKNLTFLKEENNPPAETTLAVLKPMASAEEEQLIVIEAKKRQADNTIKPANTVVVKTELPKPPTETIVAKPATQKPGETIAKTTPPKTNETAVVKTAAVPPKTTAPAVVNKPVPPKTEPAVVVKAPPVVTRPVVKTVSPVDPTAALDAGKRKVENIQALYFKSDSLRLTLYDNGEVDGDTVTVIMNGTVIMPRVGLSTNAVNKTIDTREAGDSIQIVMYAESLGSLPPNTGLLIVYDGGDRYEIRFSGDMQKSSGIVFRRRKE